MQFRFHDRTGLNLRHLRNLRDLITCGLSRQLHEFCVKFIKKMHGNVGDYKYFVTFALDYENMN